MALGRAVSSRKKNPSDFMSGGSFDAQAYEAYVKYQNASPTEQEELDKQKAIDNYKKANADFEANKNSQGFQGIDPLKGARDNLAKYDLKPSDVIKSSGNQGGLGGVFDTAMNAGMGLVEAAGKGGTDFLDNVVRPIIDPVAKPVVDTAREGIANPILGAASQPILEPMLEGLVGATSEIAGAFGTGGVVDEGIATDEDDETIGKVPGQSRNSGVLGGFGRTGDGGRGLGANILTSGLGLQNKTKKRSKTLLGA
jgi:hypothetical protein